MSDEFYQVIKGVSESAVKPLCKLIDAVSSGMGLLYEPMHVRRMAKADGDALVYRAATEISLADMKQRAAARLTNTELQRQANIESIVEKATKKLPEACSATPVDKDWMASYFDCCKDVGNQEVQELWGKLLSDEVAQPGSYSRRALDSLRLMSRPEAALFVMIGFRIWKLDNWPVLFIPKGQGDQWPVSCPFLWRHISVLGEIGLIDPQVCDEMQSAGRDRDDMTFDYHGQRFVGRTSPLGSNRARWINFTSVGAELVPLVTQEAGLKDAYFEACCDCLSTKRWQPDTSSTFRQLIVPDDLLRSLNLARETPDS